VDRFIDRALAGDALPAQLTLAPREEETVSALVSGISPGAKAELHVAAASGPWSKREWAASPAAIDGAKLTARLPAERPLVYFFSVTAADGLQATSVYGEAN
jgi:hypothetical protein